MVYAYLNTELLLHSAFMLSMLKMPLKGRLEAIHQIVMEITLLIIENHVKHLLPAQKVETSRADPDQTASEEPV